MLYEHLKEYPFDAQMKALKTDVVNFRDKYYIVGIYDDGYALLECEV